MHVQESPGCRVAVVRPGRRQQCPDHAAGELLPGGVVRIEHVQIVEVFACRKITKLALGGRAVNDEALRELKAIALALLRCFQLQIQQAAFFVDK